MSVIAQEILVRKLKGFGIVYVTLAASVFVTIAGILIHFPAEVFSITLEVSFSFRLGLSRSRIPLNMTD